MKIFLCILIHHIKFGKIYMKVLVHRVTSTVEHQTQFWFSISLAQRHNLLLTVPWL